MGIVNIIGGLIIGGLLFALLTKVFDIFATGSGWLVILAVCFIIGAFITGLIANIIGTILKILLIAVGIIAGIALLYMLFKKLFGKSEPTESNDNDSNTAE